MQNIPTVFDITASKFAAIADSQIEGRKYRRGELFLNAALTEIPPRRLRPRFWLWARKNLSDSGEERFPRARARSIT